MKLAIVIQNCAAYKDRRDAIRESWLRDVPAGIDSFFVVGGDGAEGTYKLACGDEYKDAASKQFAAIAAFKDYDHVFFCDDDTYVVVDRLLKCGFENHDYTGFSCGLYHDSSVMMAHGGAGFWMSSNAMKMATEIGLDHPSVLNREYSDQAIGYAMKIAKIAVNSNKLFNMGKYNGTKGFCNLVPTRTNKYITTHYVRPEMYPLIYSHFQEGTPLPPNRYALNFNGIQVDIHEIEDKWAYSLMGEQKFRGWYEVAQDAEGGAYQEIQSILYGRYGV